MKRMAMEVPELVGRMSKEAQALYSALTSFYNTHKTSITKEERTTVKACFDDTLKDLDEEITREETVRKEDEKKKKSRSSILLKFPKLPELPTNATQGIVDLYDTIKINLEYCTSGDDDIKRGCKLVLDDLQKKYQDAVSRLPAITVPKIVDWIDMFSDEDPPLPPPRKQRARSQARL
jgi:hypothetical protein